MADHQVQGKAPQGKPALPVVGRKKLQRQRENLADLENLAALVKKARYEAGLQLML